MTYKQIGLFFLDSKIRGHGDIKLRVVVVDVSDDYVHSGGGCLKKEKNNKKHKKDQYKLVFLYIEN